MKRGKMKHEDKLRIQAWMDSELAPKEAARIATLIEQNPEALALSEELRVVENALHLGEKPAILDDSRDFYWSQIERQIDAEEPLPEPYAAPVFASGNLLRWMVPVGSLGAIVLLMINFGVMNPKVQPSATGIAPEAPAPAAPTGLTESASGLEDESTEPGGMGVINFQGIQGSRHLMDPEDPNTLPESIENPDR
jgi:negative regulator of sigma E activity